MEQGQTAKAKEVSEYRIDKPVFVPYEVKVPKFIDEPIKVPSGWEDVIDFLAQDIANKVLDKCEKMIKERLDLCISKRLTEVECPKLTIIEEKKVIYNDIMVDRAVITDRPVINAVIKDVEVKNAVVRDVPVLNAVVENIVVKNAVVENVPVTNIIMTKEVKAHGR